MNDEHDLIETKSFNLPSKQDFDLYIEANDIKNPVIRVKRQVKKQQESWLIFYDDELFLTLPGQRFAKKDQVFLRTVEGFNFMLTQAKIGISSISHFKRLLKERNDCI